MSEPTYEVWHHDGRRPEVLSGGHPDKGACRRAWRLSTHAAIVAGGVVLEVKGTCGAKEARAIASAAAEAHRSATGQAPEMAPRGVPGGDGKRLAESSRPALRALDALPEPMPAKHVPGPVEIYAPAPKPARPWATEIADDEVAVTRSEPALSPKAAAKLRAFDTPAPSPPAAVPFDEAPAPVVVVTRKPRPATQETPMPAAITTGRCPCGEPSAPTAANRAGGGRASTPEFADLCKAHRIVAMDRRRRRGLVSAEARAEVLALIADQPAPRPAPSKSSKAPASKPRPSKPAPAARPSKLRTAEAPVSDLLAVIRRQRAVVDALGGIDGAEAVVRAADRVGGPVALVQLVDELAGVAP